MTIIYYLLVLIFGLIVGSFLNAVIYRLHERKSFLKGRSLCPKCLHPLVAADLIPVLSYVLLKGRCRYCHEKISWHYTFVELLTAFIFSALFFYYGFSLAFFLYLVLSSFLILIFDYDLKYHLILDKVSVPAIILALAFSLILRKSVLDIILGGLGGGAFFHLQYLISNGRWVGGGDSRLGMIMGFALGWQSLLVAFFLAYFIGSIVAVTLIMLKIKKLKSHLPFAAFLVPATLIALVYGESLVKWYLDGGLVNWILY